MKLSIIIPVYKVEKYIERCLDSCLNQNISKCDYEIIAVDDGSPDNCPAILDEYSRRNQNFKVLHQNNQGLSVARNNGLDIANGDYIWFVDSDDWIKENSLHDLLTFLDGYVDIVQIGFRYIYENELTEKDYRQFRWSNYLSGPQAYLAGGITTPAQFSIMRRKFLLDNNLRFYPGILHEDVEFKPRAVIKAEKCVYYPDSIYYYFQRGSGSITSNYSVRNACDALTGCKSLVSYASNNNLTLIQNSVIGTAIGVSINHILKNIERINVADKLYILEGIKTESKIFNYMLLSKKLKHRLEAMCFLANFNIGSFVFKIVNKFL